MSFIADPKERALASARIDEERVDALRALMEEHGLEHWIGVIDPKINKKIDEILENARRAQGEIYGRDPAWGATSPERESFDRTKRVRRLIEEEELEEDDGTPAYARTYTGKKDAKGKVKGPRGHCNHCGKPTGGGRFLPGHDAKLKGILARASDEGDEQARLELVLREWRTADDFDSPLPEVGDPDQFLRDRVKERTNNSGG